MLKLPKGATQDLVVVPLGMMHAGATSQPDLVPQTRSDLDRILVRSLSDCFGQGRTLVGPCPDISDFNPTLVILERYGTFSPNLAVLVS